MQRILDWLTGATGSQSQTLAHGHTWYVVPDPVHGHALHLHCAHDDTFDIFDYSSDPNELMELAERIEYAEHQSQIQDYLDRPLPDVVDSQGTNK